MYQDYAEKYPNIGKKWNEMENERLLQLLSDVNRPLESIAYDMGRSKNSILLQAVKILRKKAFY